MTGAVTALTARIPALAWFGHGGGDLAVAETAHARAWLGRLGFDVPVAAVKTWRDAAALIQRPDWSQEWWQAETDEAARLRPAGDDALNMLGGVTEAASTIHDQAAAALARAGIRDAALAKVASGAAAQACHHYALALLADSPDHAFAHKFALFAAGRWPLGIVGGTGFVF